MTAAIAALLPGQAGCAGDTNRCRRRGLGLDELPLPVRRPAARPRSGSPGRPSGPLLDISVFFTWVDSAPVVVHGDAALTTGLPPRRGTPGLGGARRRLRELREAERAGVLSHRLVVDTFERINHQSRNALPLRATLDPLGALVEFAQLRHLVHSEAAAEGPAALAELAEAEDRYRLAAELLARRRRAGMTQRDLAARSRVPQHYISELENGCANPTLTTLGALARALGTAVTLE